MIPAYNESLRLASIVVNDGSSDDTPDIVRRYEQKHENVRLQNNPGNRGKGYSVRNGVLNAQGSVILFTDADLSAPIEEAPKLLQALAEGADIAIGSRWARSELQTRRQPLMRQILGRAFNILARVLLNLDFTDTQCGFKAFRREAARSVFPMQRIERWGFDPEVLFLAQESGFRVVEVPVRWAHDDRTRINPLADGSRMVADMLRIRWYSLTGNYAEDRSLASTSPARAAQRRHS